jgi:hypothetical protein
MKPVHDELELLQRNALLTILQTMQAGGRHPELPRKHSISRLPSSLSKKTGQVIVQRLPHKEDAGQLTVPFAEYFA